MSAERCILCGVSGTTTNRCCGNNKEYRIKELNQMIEHNQLHIQILKEEILEFLNERSELTDEE